MFEAKISDSARALVGLLLLTVGCGAPGAEIEDEGTLNILVENDKFAGTDHHYTNGLQFSYLSPKDDVPQLLRRFASVLPGIPDGSDLRAGYSFYLLGEIAATPWWHYHLVALLMKTPLPTLASN
jgi:hypothetical protein